MPWRQLLLDSHTIAVLSAAGVALLAYSGDDLARNAQPRIARVVAPAQAAEAVLPKGPELRLTGAQQDRTAEEQPLAVPPADEQARRDEPAPPPRAQRAFEVCLPATKEYACRRAFEAAIERMRARERPGSQHFSMMPALLFDESPQWRRRIEALSDEGIAFKRVRRNDHDILIGITPDGVLGFQLEERSSGR